MKCETSKTFRLNEMRVLRFDRIVRPPITHYYLNEPVYVFNLIDPNRPKIIDKSTENDINSLKASMPSYGCSFRPQCSRHLNRLTKLLFKMCQHSMDMNVVVCGACCMS